MEDFTRKRAAEEHPQAKTTLRRECPYPYLPLCPSGQSATGSATGQLQVTPDLAPASYTGGNKKSPGLRLQQNAALLLQIDLKQKGRANRPKTHELDLRPKSTVQPKSTCSSYPWRPAWHRSTNSRSKRHVCQQK